MPRFRYVSKFDVKTPDTCILRSKVEEWIEHRFQMLEQAHREYLKASKEHDENMCRTAWNKYNNNFSLLEHVIRFMCEVDLMSPRTGKEYVDKMYKFVIEDIEDKRKRGQEE